eukprot:gene10494-14058_t
MTTPASLVEALDWPRIETELAAALQVSRVPIREAMRILESQGIIVATPRRGMRVATLDDAWARQLHQVRVAI